MANWNLSKFFKPKSKNAQASGTKKPSSRYGARNAYGQGNKKPNSARDDWQARFRKGFSGK